MQLVTCKKFSTLSSLLGVTVQVLRGVKKFKSFKNSEPNTPTTLSPEELAETKLFWITSAQ